jgi:hypothetical protein
MSEDGWWKRVRDELNSPWDWVAAGIGAAGGLAVSASTLHLDMGSSIGVGAIGAVTMRKSAMLSLKGRTLHKRTKALLKMVVEWSDNRILPMPNDCGRNIDRDYQLWQRKLISNVQYEQLLDGHIELIRKLAAQPTRSLPAPTPAPSPAPHGGPQPA